jgi:hypothetical protein
MGNFRDRLHCSAALQWNEPNPGAGWTGLPRRRVPRTGTGNWGLGGRRIRRGECAVGRPASQPAPSRSPPVSRTARPFIRSARLPGSYCGELTCADDIGHTHTHTHTPAGADTKAPPATRIPPYRECTGLDSLRVFPFPVCRCTRGRGGRCCFLSIFFASLGRLLLLCWSCARDHAELYTCTVTEDRMRS